MFEEPNQNNVNIEDYYIKKCRIRKFSLLPINEIKEAGFIVGKGITSFYINYDRAIVKSNNQLLVGRNADKDLVKCVKEYLKTDKKI